MASLKTTWMFGIARESGNVGDSLTGTLFDEGKREGLPNRMSIDLDDTVVGPREPSVPQSIVRASLSATEKRTTVLPRRSRSAEGTPHPTLEGRPRFERVRLLGEGGVGTVELARDNDIRRTVAVKKLRSEVRSEGALLRFADEVRIVGQLEHPNIVPIYDVGSDEAGDVYLVMKHLTGETVADVIAKLKAGDAAYRDRFTVERRARLFLLVLDAVRYAHSRGVLHRDLKPANIMIGPYDEVTVMDWGIAKPIGARDPVSAAKDTPASWIDSQDHRLVDTQLGTLAGTPLYMSPEQAAGQNDSLDARSDVYSLALVFYEWLVLEHPLEGKSNLLEVLGTIMMTEHDAGVLTRRAGARGVPREYVYLILRCLRRDRGERLASVDRMYQQLTDVLDGKVPIECPVTFTKRATHEALHWVDRHQTVFVAFFVIVSAGLLLGTLTLALLSVRFLVG